MDRARNEFFAGPGLAEDQHARIRGCYYRHETQRSLEHWALSDDLAKLGPNFLFEIKSLLCLFVSILYRLFVVERVLNGDGYLACNLFQKGDVVFGISPL